MEQSGDPYDPALYTQKKESIDMAEEIKVDPECDEIDVENFDVEKVMLTEEKFRQLQENELNGVGGGFDRKEFYCPKCLQRGTLRRPNVEVGEEDRARWVCSNCGVLPPKAVPYLSKTPMIVAKKRQPFLFEPW